MRYVPTTAELRSCEVVQGYENDQMRIHSRQLRA